MKGTPGSFSSATLTRGFAAPFGFACVAVTLIAFALPLAASPALGTEAAGPQPSHETKAEVPELSEFHEVIYTLWHEAWPKKDAAALSALLPEIETGAAKIEKATLPGILRDRKPQWDANVRKLMEIVAAYRAAVAGKELQPLLDAGEALHSQFEVLVRTIRPALKELDAFHQTLYRLYHYDAPAYDLPKIQADATELLAKMDALNKATLPARLASKQQAYDERRKDLDGAVRAFAALAGPGKDEAAIKASIETLHSKYQALDQLF